MKLSGMKQLCKHLDRSEPTVLDMIRFLGLPAKKIGGVWESDTKLIKKWRLAQIKNESGIKKIRKKR